MMMIHNIKNIIIVLTPLIPIINIILRNKYRNKINFVSFYTEGHPYDKGKKLSDCADVVSTFAQGNFNTITLYTPRILHNLGYSKYLREYPLTPMIKQYTPVEKFGLSSFRPAMYLYELSKMRDGDILVHRDINYRKYPSYIVFDDIRIIAKKCLDICEFDFFVPKYSGNTMLNKGHVKTNVIRELGENHPFSYEYPLLHAYFFVMRKTPVTIQLLQEWQEAMEFEHWLNGKTYGELHQDFLGTHCIDQAILSVIIANWIRKRQHNIPLKYPFISFENKDFSKIEYNTNYEYLKLLE